MVEHVQNPTRMQFHLQISWWQITVTNDAKGYPFLTGAYQPFGKFGEENYSDGKTDGFYYNGGSWFRPEYCAYVVGLKHGWTKAMAIMENSVWAEI
ncbi:hypothetical protein BH09BAC6_BH09BAC6_15610 [soil metagenome]|jgi:hypothetical protein